MDENGPKSSLLSPNRAVSRLRHLPRGAGAADADDPQWCAFVSETTHAYFKALRKQLDASGRTVRLMIGILVVRNTFLPIEKRCMKKLEVEIRTGGHATYVIGTRCIWFG